LKCSGENTDFYTSLSDSKNPYSQKHLLTQQLDSLEYQYFSPWQSQESEETMECEIKFQLLSYNRTYITPAMIGETQEQITWDLWPNEVDFKNIWFTADNNLKFIFFIIEAINCVF
jgi:hypothetical protein